MEIIGTVREMQTRADGYRRSGTTIGIVPTMGSLHEGHVSLIRLAHGASDIVVTTVFVNPTQFGPNEDFHRYPRDSKRDEAVAAQSGSDILFCPEVREMYPEGYRTYVITDELSGILEGSVRPGSTRWRRATRFALKMRSMCPADVPRRSSSTRSCSISPGRWTGYRRVMSIGTPL